MPILSIHQSELQANLKKEKNLMIANYFVVSFRHDQQQDGCRVYKSDAARYQSIQIWRWGWQSHYWLSNDACKFYLLC